MNPKGWRNFDLILLGSALALVGIGIAMVYSATLDRSGASIPLWEDFAFRQGVYAIVSVILLLIVSSIDYRFYYASSRLLYGVGLLLLGLIFVLGKTVFGAQSWFDLEYFLLQPSELVKLILIVVLAKYFADHRADIQRPIHLVVSMLYMAIPVGILYLQPDFGTAVILVAIWVGMAWGAGIALWQFALIGAGGVVAAPAAWFVLKDYMRDRITAFLNPNLDPSGQSYNVIQALISIGSGGMWGKGFTQGTQSQLHFLRVRHTDFIFSVFAEEIGFMGSVVLFALFVILLWRILRAGMLSRDPFGQMITCGVAVMIFTQAAINLAVNLNVIPATGLPLPFVSYGGSSLLTMMIGLGLVQSVVMRYRTLEFE